MEKKHDWKAIDLEVISVNMLIQAVGDIKVPQRDRRRSEVRTLQRKPRTVG